MTRTLRRTTFFLALLPLGFFLLVVSGTLVSAQQVELEQEVFSIARELRCPVCRSESAADSNSPTSVEFRDIVREQLQAGQNREQIIAFFQARYGDWILLEPPRRGIHLLVWVLPVAAGLAGVALLAFFLRRWTKDADTPIEMDDEGLERVRREIKNAPAPEGRP